ncbi:MFS transporter [Massilia terrae]|uniref:MFS transporter n=2 Tax=Massilia terrae TaxID=1811224 RepID=A0ABT2CUC1_9BURK|nr:MFS transporter [Massilia terrae]MCS0656795.1 MFS transporter [Massilia terrae]
MAAKGKLRWAMLALVFGATTLNYIDRAALGIMQPVLARAMQWTAQDYANINFWFQVGYAIGYALQGRLMDSLGVRRGFALAVLVWSLAAAAHGFAAGVAGFMVCRFVLGFAEAGNYPGCVKTTRLWFPVSERALAVGIFNAGTNVGAMLTPIMIPFILAVWGWQPVFFVIGALGIAWLAAWWKHYHDPDAHPRMSAGELAHIRSTVEPAAARVPYRQVLRMRALWTFAIGHMLTAPVFWFYLYWLPPYLNQQFHLGISVAELGAPLIVIYLMADVGSIIGGALSSFMVKRGMDAVRARLLSMLLCALCLLPVVFVSSASGVWLATAYISIAIAAHQAWTANIWSLAIDMTPKEAVASVFGLGGMCSAIGGMFMTQLVGWVLTRSGNNYTLLFTMIPAAYFIALAWMFAMYPRRS